MLFRVMMNAHYNCYLCIDLYSLLIIHGIKVTQREAWKAKPVQGCARPKAFGICEALKKVLSYWQKGWIGTPRTSAITVSSISSKNLNLNQCIKIVKNKIKPIDVFDY